MGYVKATDVLPEELLHQIQEYIDGEILYIPRRSDLKKKWGDKTDTKEILATRNHNIYQEWQNGITISSLAKKYFLSEKSIQRILRHIKK